MTSGSRTVSEILQSSFDMLTRAERQLADSLLDNYPVSGLGSITQVAENAGVSTPTVVRMVQKLGFKGYPDFQQHLHQEVEATISNPIAKHDRWAANAPGTHLLNRFADAIMGNLRASLGELDPAVFDKAVALLSDKRRGLLFVGGRITGALAEYFFTHMQVIRPNTTLLSTHASAWPQYILNMKPGDILIVFDIRRYEMELVSLARAAKARGAEILLFTDRWGSPVGKLARTAFRVHIEAPSAWDSSVVTLFLVEALIEAVQTSTWDETKERMKTLEGLFEETKLFSRPDRARPPTPIDGGD